MLQAMPIGILEIKSQVHTLWAYNIIADEIPSWIGKLTQLENLTLDGSTQDIAGKHNSVLTQLPTSMGNMKRLNTMAVSNFIRLSELPETLGSLSSLQKLDLRGCDALITLPVCIVNKAFAPAIVSMSSQIHADFLRLLWVLADKQMRSYYDSMGKEDKIRTEAFRWARAKVFNCNKTSVGMVIAFGRATRCHLSVHSLAMPRSGPDDG